MAEEWKIEPASADLQLHLQLTERVKKLEDQMSWILARFADTGDNPKIQKLEIQVNCLRKQVLDIEGKKSYTEQARDYAKDREIE
jgi:hypothetical protein